MVVIGIHLLIFSAILHMTNVESVPVFVTLPDFISNKAVEKFTQN